VLTAAGHAIGGLFLDRPVLEARGCESDPRVLSRWRDKRVIRIIAVGFPQAPPLTLKSVGCLLAWIMARGRDWQAAGRH
jgi:hypothetical protein